MKKLFRVLLLVFSIMSVSCAGDINSGDSSSGLRNYTISFNSNGGSSISSITKKYGTFISKPSDPKKNDYEFSGWFYDQTYSSVVEWPHKITESKTFYASWDIKPLSSTEISNLFKDSVFKIKIQNSNKVTVKQGSGFIIKSDGTFVTNAHVMDGAWYAYSDFDGLVTDYEIEWIYAHNNASDYSVGKIKTSSVRTFKAVEFTTNYKIGTKVFSIGYPNNSYTRTVKSGEILGTNYRVSGSSIGYIKTSANIDHGSSGGILATNTGKVIGMTTAKFDDGYYGSVPASYFSSWSTASAPLSTRKSPLDYFHPEIKVSITSNNIMSYFDIKVKLNSSSFNYGLITADYTVTSQWKGGSTWYIPVTSTNVSIIVQIRIDYTYKTSYNYTYSSSSTKLVTLNFYSINSLYGTNTVTSYAYFSINYGASYTLTGVFDSWTIFNAYGTVASRI
jgi:uncharacterized repeat protein (TIGR02543 family)